MSYYGLTLAANAVYEIHEQGQFFRLLASTGPVRVSFYRRGSLISETDNIQAGYWRRSPPGDYFDKVRVTNLSGSANTLEMLVDQGEVGYDRSAGTVTVTGEVDNVLKRATVTQNVATVTSTSGILVAANTNRRYLMIQNKDSTGLIHLRLDGNAATLSNGIAIQPKGYWESSSTWICTAAVHAIGSIASNANVLVVEGS